MEEITLVTNKNGTQDEKQQKIQVPNRPKDREIEFTNKEVWKKRNEKVFNTGIWLIHNVKVV